MCKKIENCARETGEHQTEENRVRGKSSESSGTGVQGSSGTVGESGEFRDGV